MAGPRPGLGPRPGCSGRARCIRRRRPGGERPLEGRPQRRVAMRLQELVEALGISDPHAGTAVGELKGEPVEVPISILASDAKGLLILRLE